MRKSHLAWTVVAFGFAALVSGCADDRIIYRERPPFNPPPDVANGFLGYLYLPALAALVVSSMLTVPLGVRLAHRTSPAPLRKAFGALLALVSIQLLVSALR